MARFTDLPLADASVVDWVGQELDLTQCSIRGIRSALDAWEGSSRARAGAWGLEWHHDGSDHVDVSVFGGCSPSRVEFDGLTFASSPSAVWEFDVDAEGSATLAGVFHQPVGAVQGPLPDRLRRLGDPLLVAHLVGRERQVRFIYAVPDEASTARLIDALAGTVLGRRAASSLHAAAAHRRDGIEIRVGLELVVAAGRASRVGSRLGIEIVANPSLVDVGSLLRDLGVGDAAMADMHSLASRLPIARLRGHRIEGLGGITVDAVADAIGFVHASVSWTGGQPVLKSYLMVTSTPRQYPTDAGVAVGVQENGPAGLDKA